MLARQALDLSVVPPSPRAGLTGLWATCQDSRMESECGSKTGSGCRAQLTALQFGDTDLCRQWLTLRSCLTSSMRPPRYRLRKGSKDSIARCGDEKTHPWNLGNQRELPAHAQAVETTLCKEGVKRGEECEPQQAEGPAGSEGQRSYSGGWDRHIAGRRCSNSLRFCRMMFQIITGPA